MLSRAHKLIGPTRITVPPGLGVGALVRLPPYPGGADIKDALFFIKVIASSSSTAYVQLTLEHGPDPAGSVSHSIPIGTTAVGSIYPVVLEGSTDADTDGQLGEWLHPVVRVMGVGVWVLLEVFAMGKPS